ncbi:MAG: 50S ribosomal protein L25/general stress protein Ctc [Rickettsiales bacterium]|jgi:large subunit ribosomal protein L25|nr:50S ribosomal protein L25/general stress protein Ctc [Rickettsiales bacterium]
MVEIVSLAGFPREDLGSAVARRLRKNNRLPAVVYGGGLDNIFLAVDVREFEKEYFRGGIETRIFDIAIPQQRLKVLCQRVDLDPRSDRPRHVDFLSLEGRKEVKVLVPIRFKNADRSMGLKRGGYLNIMVRKLPLICPVDSIPSEIEVNCEDMKLRQSVRLWDLALPEGSRPVSRNNILIARIIGRGKDEEAPGAQAAASPSATPASGVAGTTTAAPTGGQAAAGHGTARK